MRGAEDAVRLARWLLSDRDRETFLVPCLDVKLAVNAGYAAAVGSLDYCPVHPREVFTAALLSKAAPVILGHNHPSGDPTPSPEDCAITRRLVDAGEILGIPVQDRVIVAHDRTYSFREAGVMPPPRTHGRPSRWRTPASGS